MTAADFPERDFWRLIRLLDRCALRLGFLQDANYRRRVSAEYARDGSRLAVAETHPATNPSNGDPFCGYCACDFLLQVPIDVVDLVVKAAGVGITCAAHGVGFGEGEVSSRTSVRVEVPPNVIELDGSPSNLLPHPKTVVSHGGHEIGGLVFRPVAVPHVERFQEERASGIRVDEVPEAYDRTAIVLVLPIFAIWRRKERLIPNDPDLLLSGRTTGRRSTGTSQQHA